MQIAQHTIPTAAPDSIIIADEGSAAFNNPIETQNQIDSVLIFKQQLKDKQPVFDYADQIQTYFQKSNYQPILVPGLLANSQLQDLLGYLEDATHHGLDPELFMLAEIKRVMVDLNNPDSINTLASYKNQVDLELLTANALLKYSIAMQFGLVNPDKLDTNYFIPTAYADSAFMMQVFEIKDLKRYLDSIQPKSSQYLSLQNALRLGQVAPGKTAAETKGILAANLERLRWKNKPSAEKYVLVNIADFNLNVIDKGQSVLQMKVCVGDAKGWQTPQLSSKIYSVQVNPVWNVPVSIARTELKKNAINNRYYLANNNIEVYKKGKLIGNSASIDWSVNDPGTYSFKQLPGTQNALGKIKFLFNNQSNVYLHDTPKKSAFKQTNRAISHGCVRVESPLKLAQVLFGEGPKFTEVKQAILKGYPAAKYIGLPQGVPVVITYFTAFASDDGKLRFCKDVYGLDEVLWNKFGNSNLKL